MGDLRVCEDTVDAEEVYTGILETSKATYFPRQSVDVLVRQSHVHCSRIRTVWLHRHRVLDWPVRPDHTEDIWCIMRIKEQQPHTAVVSCKNGEIPLSKLQQIASSASGYLTHSSF